MGRYTPAMKLTVLAVCLLQALAVPLQPEVAMELELVAQTTLAGRPYQSGPSYEWLPRWMGPNTKKGPHDLQKKSTKECQIEDRNQQLHVPAAQCMVAILPFVKIGMAQKDRGYLDTVARKKGVVGGIAKFFTQGGCTSDAECLTKQGSMCHNQHGSMWTGLSARASCDFQKGSLKGPRTNVCVCGIFADHVKTKEECNGKNMPKHINTMTAQELMAASSLELSSESKAEEKVECTGGTVPGHVTELDRGEAVQDANIPDAATSAAPVLLEEQEQDRKGVISSISDAKRAVNHYFSSEKQFPIWENTAASGRYCALGYLPYVKCARPGCHLPLTTCSKDSDCMCAKGCPGDTSSVLALMHGSSTLTWQPVCYKRGTNKCICALVGSQVHSTEGCTWPALHKENDIVKYFAKGSGDGAGAKWWEGGENRGKGKNAVINTRTPETAETAVEPKKKKGWH